MSLATHLKENIAIYLVTAVLIPTAWAGFMAIMDQRHEPVGSSIKSELRQVRSKTRELENYERFAPSDTYGPARQATIAELKQIEKELEEELELLK